MRHLSLTALLLLGFSTSVSAAELKPEKIYIADAKKNGRYLKSGLLTGGGQAIQKCVIQGIRRSVNPGFERIVIDLEGKMNSETPAVSRAPYYQVAILSAEKQLQVSFWGQPQLEFDAEKVIQEFKKSKVIQNILLLPRLEEKVWTFALDLKAEPTVEIFELTQPIRLILDIKYGPRPKP